MEPTKLLIVTKKFKVTACRYIFLVNSDQKYVFINLYKITPILNKFEYC